MRSGPMAPTVVNRRRFKADGRNAKEAKHRDGAGFFAAFHVGGFKNGEAADFEIQQAGRRAQRAGAAEDPLAGYVAAVRTGVA